MSTRFDALIAERLGISEERAQKLLRAMLKEIRTRAADEDVRFPELGTFRAEEGTLTFSPSPSLRRLVNEEYEGLQPESAPPPSRPDPADETDDRETSAPPGSADEPEPLDEPEPEDEPELEDEPEPEGEPEPESPWEPGAQPSAGDEDEYPVVDEDLRYDAAAGTEEGSPADGPNEPPRREAEEGPERGGTAAMSMVDSFQLLVGILLVVFLIAAGWFVLSQTRVLSSGPTSSPRAQASGAGADSVVAEMETEPQAEEDTSSGQPARFRGTPPGPNDPPDTIDSAAAGWTIVVASVPDRSTAEDMRRQYEAQFSTSELPVEILSATVDGTVRYRVVIGQYSSREAVVQALEEHATQLPDGAWVLEL